MSPSRGAVRRRTVRPRVAALLAVVALVACQPTDPEFPPIDGVTGVEETECTGQGGRITVGLAGPTCAVPTPDAGQSCTSGEACSGFCLAPEGDGPGQCSPETPYFGCHELLMGDGERAVLCVD